MDYEKLKGLYGRLIGVSESLPDRKGDNFEGIIADDYNLIVGELSKLIQSDLETYKIPHNQYWNSGSRQYASGGSATKIRQLISYLKYTYNLDEKIMELGSLINAIENHLVSGLTVYRAPVGSTQG